MMSFKGKHFPKDVVLFAVFFYVRYAVSYLDLEEIMAERGIDVDHATINRWVIEYGPLLAEEAQKRALLQKLSLVALVKDGLVGDFPLSVLATELFHALQIP